MKRIFRRGPKNSPASDFETCGPVSGPRKRTILANCPDHGDIYVKYGDFLLLRDSNDEFNNRYRITCRGITDNRTGIDIDTDTKHVVFAVASRRIAELLVSEGVEVRYVDPRIPSEHPTISGSHSHLDEITTDEVIALGTMSLGDFNNDVQQL